MGLIKTTISLCVPLLWPCCASLSPTGEQKWHKMHLGQKKRIIASSVCVVCWLCLNLHLSCTHSPRQCWRKDAIGGGSCCSRQLRTEHKTETFPGKVGIFWISLPPLNYSYGRGWKRGMSYEKFWGGSICRIIEMKRRISSLKIPNSLSISDFYSLVTRMCYHKLDKGIDSRLFSCPYVPSTHKAPIMEQAAAY